MASASQAPDPVPLAAGVKVEAGFIPWPKTISAEARAFMASMVAPDGSPHPRPPRPAVDDHAGWIANREATNALLAAMAERVAVPAAQAELVEMAGAAVYVATPDILKSDRHAFLNLHGGAWIYGGGALCRYGALKTAASLGVRCYAVDYRKPPEHPYPAALDDCLAVYRALLDQYGAANIVIGGGSAGGNLAAALALRARDEGLPLPAGIVLITPALDRTQSGDSMQVNAAADVVMGDLSEVLALYVGDHPGDHPYISPLNGDFTQGFPPAFIQAGTRDMLLSDAVRMHRALCRADVPAELHVFEGMPHGGFWNAPEDVEMEEAVARFVWQRWA